MKNSKIFISLVFIFLILCSGVCMASEKVKLTVPTFERLSDEVVEYNGEEQTLELKYFSDDLMTITNNKQKEIGKYDITIALKYPEEYEWEIYDEATGTYSYTTENQILKWEIVIAELRIPYQRSSKEYNGKEQEPNLKYYNYDDHKYLISISGDCKATEIGTYVATASLIDKERSMWEDGTTEDKNVVWKIVTNKTNVPKQNRVIEYTGEEQSFELYDYQKDIMTITGNKATNAGKYIAKVSLKDKKNYEWAVYDEQIEDYIYTTDDQEFEWEISTKKLNVPERDGYYDIEYTGQEQLLNLRYYGYDEEIINIVGNKATDVGKYTATVSLKDKNNYEWKLYDEQSKLYTLYTTEDQTIEWEIVIGKLCLPRLNSQKNYYNGKEISTSFTYYIYDSFVDSEMKADNEEIKNIKNLIIITNDKATNAGTHIIKVSLKDKENFVWRIRDEKNNKWVFSNEDQEFEWKIEKKSINIPSVSKSCNYTGEEQEVILKKFDEELMNISGDKATEIGEYKAIISLKDKNNYQWANGTTEDVTLTWQITQGILKIPGTSSSAYTNRYTGNEQKANIDGFDEEIMDISGDKATEVGTYKAIISIKDKTKYQWEDGTTEDITLTWHIKKATCDIEVVNRNLILGEELKVLITPNITDGTLVVWYEEKNNGGVYNKNQLPTETGLYKIKIQVLDDKNLLETIKEEYIIIEEDKNNSNTNSTTTATTTSSSRGGGSSSSTITYKATITQTTGGTIAVNESEVEKGDKQVFVIMADDGYKIVDVKVDGKSVGAVNTYTIEKVTKKHKITATFEKLTEEELKELEENKETTWVNTFDDVNNNDWYYEAVKFVNEAGLFKGLSSTEFGANVTMNRAMIVTVLHRLAGETKASNNNINFNDISNEEYYTNAVIWAVENGIVNGVGNNEFAPQNNVTREQLIVMLYRYTKLNGKLTENNANLSSYDDENLINDYAKEAFSWAIQEGIITGRTTTTLVPQGIATRAEVATMIMRFSNMINEV